MTPMDKEVQDLRRDMAHLMKSGTVRTFAEKDRFGRFVNDIDGIDRCIMTMARREREAKLALQAAESEIVRLRRQVEALMIEKESEGA